MNRLRVLCLIVVLALNLITIANGYAGVLPRVPEGQVRFYNIADSEFDPYSAHPSSSDQAWMRDHYTRMQTYSPYFDSRLSWFPNAWVYKDSFAIKPNWPIFKAHPEWVLRDSNSNLLFIQ